MQGRCDVEVGKPGNRHLCLRKATVQRLSASGYVLQFCRAHERIAHDAPIEHFRPAPFSEVEPVRE